MCGGSNPSIAAKTIEMGKLFSEMDLELVNNDVLISYVDTENELKTKSGIFIDTTFEPHKYAPVEGVCIKSNNDEIQPGDKLTFHYLTIVNAKKTGATISKPSSIGPDKYEAIIPIESMVFFIERDGKIIFVNGYVLCSKVKRKNISKFDDSDIYESNQFEIVYDGYGFKKGQIVATMPDCDVPYVENKIMGDVDVFRVHIKNIVALIDGSNIIPIPVFEKEM